MKSVKFKCRMMYPNCNLNEYISYSGILDLINLISSLTLTMAKIVIQEFIVLYICSGGLDTVLRRNYCKGLASIGLLITYWHQFLKNYE